MFRRTDDSEWSRFTKGGGREDAPDAPPADAADLPPPPPAPAGAGGRPPLPDVNVTLTRPSPPPMPAMPPPPAPGGASQPEVETVIGQESSVQGTIRSEHSIRVQGAAQGEMESKRSIYVEDGARVAAKVTATEILISGQLDGQIFATGRVEIRPSGRVTGEINAPSLVMQEGAFFDGQVKMNSRSQAEPGAEREGASSTGGRRLPQGGASAARGANSTE